MSDGQDRGYLAECLWPGVGESDLRALDARTRECACTLADEGIAVRYLGSLLVPEDEIVMCFFRGSPDAVRLLAVCAGIPCERILEGICAPRAPSRREGHMRGPAHQR